MAHQHRVAGVDAQGDVGVAPAAKDRGGAGVGVDAGKVVRAQHQGALGLGVQLVQAVQKEGAARLLEAPLGAAEQQHAELEARVHVRKQALAVLEVEQRAQPPAGADAAKELGRALVGGDAAGGEQRHQPAGLHQRLRTLDEQAVEVDVAAAQQRVVAGLGQHAGVGLGALGGLRVFGRQRGVLVLQRGDQGLAVGGARLGGDGGVALGKPLDLLQLDAVPRRVAQHHVEAAAPLQVEHVGKGGPPVEEALARGQPGAGLHQRGGVRGAGFAGVQRAGGQRFDQIAPRRQQRRQGAAGGVVAQLLQFGGLVDRPAGQQPAQRAPEVEQAVQRRGTRLGLLRELLRLARLGDVDVGQVGHLRQPLGGQRQPLQRTGVEQRAQRLQAAAHRRQRLAVQRVAALEVVVQKRQRRADGEGVQPQRGLGQLDRHGVLVDAEHAFLQDHAAHDVAVVELGVGHGPAVARGLRLDFAPDGGDAPDHRAFPGVAALGQVRRPGLGVDQGAGAAGGLQHAVGQVVDQRDQEVAAAHGRVAHRQFQDLRGRVDGVALRLRGAAVQALPLRRAEGGARLPAGQRLLERGHALGGQAADRFAQQQAHQVGVRVVAARDLARKAGRARDDAVDLGQFAVAVARLHLVHQLVFEQALVDATQVRHRQVAVVDPTLEQVLGAPRQRVDQRCQQFVGHGGALQQRGARAAEQAAVVGRHADVVVALVDQAKHPLERQPDLGHGAGEGAAGVDLVAHLLANAAQAVFGVALVVHRQQAPVFGVEQKQQAVQQHQGGFAHFVEVVVVEPRARVAAVADGVAARGQVVAREGVGQLREDFIEDARAQVLRDLFFVQPRLVQRVLVARAAGGVPGLGQKGVAAEEQVKQPQRVRRRGCVQLGLGAGQGEGLRQVELEKVFRARARVLPVQAPDRTVGQHAPLERAVGGDVDPAEVAQHLRRGGVGVEHLGGVAAVERALPALGLQNGDAVAVTAVVARLGQRGGLVLGAGKQQPVGHRLAPARVGVDLRQQLVAPAEGAQQRHDQQRLGLRLVDRRAGRQRGKQGAHGACERREGRVIERLPGWRVEHAAQQEVLGKKLALHEWAVDAGAGWAASVSVEVQLGPAPESYNCCS